MKVAVVQHDITWQDKAANHASVEAMLAGASIEPGTYVVLPELGDTGFSFDLDAIVDDRTLPWACDLARRCGIWLQAGYAERGADGRGRNCAAIVTPAGEVAGVYRKVHPFSYGKESQHYGGGERLCVVDTGAGRVCPVICYDLRFPELWRLGALAGAEVFTIGASWPDARQAHWRALMIARAIENQAAVVAVNRVGSDPHLRYAGGSLVVSPMGEVLAEADNSPAVLTARIDVDALRRWRADFPALADIRARHLGSIQVDATITKTDVSTSTARSSKR